MKATIKIEKEVEIKTLHVAAGVRYFEDSIVNGVEDENGRLMPFLMDELWNPIIDIDKGEIIDWPKGTTADIHYKVCDNGSYFIKDEKGETVLSIEGDYVPSILSPTENGYGDYIIMKVDENGKIEGWKKDISSFQKDDE